MIRRYHRYRVVRRWRVALALLACVAFHVVFLARFLLSPEQFRARTRLLLQQQFGGDVQLGEAAYEFPAGFRLKDLCVSRPAERGGGEMFRTKALSVDLGLLALLRGKVAVEELVLEEPEAHLTRGDLAAMQRPEAKGPGPALGRIVVRGGRIVLGKGLLFEDSPERELTDIRVQLTEERRFSPGYNFEGEANSALWGLCELEGKLDLGGRYLKASANARSIPIGARLRESIPAQYASYAKALDAYALDGQVDLKLETELSWADKGSMALAVAVDLRDCSAAWERFPLRVTDIRGRITFDGTNIYYQGLTGRAGPTTVTLSGQSTKEKVEIHLVGPGRPLDRELYEAAPPNAVTKTPNLKGLWDRCGIEGGFISIDHRSTYWRAERRFEATIRSEVRDVRATYKPFPYPLEGVAGSVRWENGVSHIESLRGRRGPARVHIRGQITDAGVPDLTIEASDVPFDATLYQALPPERKKTYDLLRPEGTAAVHCTVTSPKGDPKEYQYRFVIRPEGAAFQHQSFPHKVTDVRGDILVDEAGTVSFRDLRGRLGAIPLQFFGTVRPGEKGPVQDITVVAPEVELTPSVRPYLPKEWATVYDELDPRGKVSFTWRMTTDPATGASRHSSEVTCLQDCSVQHKLFPVRVTNLIGRFTVDETGRTTFTGMKGRVGHAPVEALVGQCGPEGMGTLRLTLRASGLDLDDEIRKAVPEAWRTVWDEVRPAGEAVVEYQLTGNPAKPDQPGQRVTIEPSNGSFCYHKLPIPVTEVTRGKVVFDQDGNTTISNIQGKVRGKAVVLGGKVVMGSDGGVLNIDVTADELDLDAELRRALPPDWQKIWDDLRPAGKIAATASGAIHTRKGDWQRFRLDATLKGCEATWTGLPVRVTGLRGRFDYEEGVVNLTDVAGESALADTVRLNGRIARMGSGSDRLQVTIQNLRLVPDLFSALPAEVKKGLEAAELKGTADLVELTLSNSGKPDGVTQCFGLVRLRDASFRHTEQPVEQVSGNLRIDKGVLHADGTQTLEGGLDLRKLVARKFVLTDLKSALTYTRTRGVRPSGAEATVRVGDADSGAREGKDKPLQSKLALNDLAASFYGGSLNGKLALDLDTGAFASWLALTNADFKTFCREALGSDDPATGKLTVRVEFPPGQFKGEKNLIGDGGAWVEQGDLGQLPLAASLLNALSLRSPLDRSITRAEVKFGMTKDHLVIKEASLEGQRRILTGFGTAGYDGALNLRLVSPKPAGRGLWDLVEVPLNLLREQLVQVDVRGTISKPDVQILAVPPVTQLVDQFAVTLGLWRKRQPPKPEAPPPSPAPPEPAPKQP